MEVKTLYKRDSKGKTRVWSIYVERTESGPGHTVTEISPALLVINAGLLGGKLVEQKYTIAAGKNIGKSNETTPYQQAVSEAESKIEAQRKDGYVDRVDELKDAKVLGSGLKEPALAHKYHPQGKQSNSKTLDQLKIRGKKMGLQRKKDGNRAYVVIIPNGTLLPDIEYRNRKTQLYEYNFPNLTVELQTSYAICYGVANTETIILDGEFFTRMVSFNKLNGILKAKTLKPGYKEVLDSCTFHLFDKVSEKNYIERHKEIECFASPLVEVEEYEIVEATEENFLAYLRKVQAEGEEGAMIRALDQPYKFGRSYDLLKYKDDQTEDYKILGFEEHAAGGMVGAIVMEVLGNLKDRDGKLITSFKAGTTGLSHEESREMWQNQKDYIGFIGTVRFFELSEYGIPRFPKFVGIRADA